jgi:hypothetical protein
VEELEGRLCQAPTNQQAVGTTALQNFLDIATSSEGLIGSTVALRPPPRSWKRIFSETMEENANEHQNVNKDGAGLGPLGRSARCHQLEGHGGIDSEACDAKGKHDLDGLEVSDPS